MNHTLYDSYYGCLNLGNYNYFNFSKRKKTFTYKTMYFPLYPFLYLIAYFIFYKAECIKYIKKMHFLFSLACIVCK